MAQVTAIARTTSAVAYTDAASKPFDSSKYSSVVVSADNLATTEEVDIYALSGGTWKAVVNVSGTAQKLTASIPHLKLESGPLYKCAKDATAGACGVYFDMSAA